MSLLLSKKFLRSIATTSFKLGDAFYKQHGDLAVLIAHASVPPLPPLQAPFSFPEYRFLPPPSPFKPVTSVGPVWNVSSAALFHGQCSLFEYEELQERLQEQERTRRQAEIETYKKLLDELEQPEVGPTDVVPYYSEPPQATPVELAIEGFHQTIADTLDAVSSIKKAIEPYMPTIHLNFPPLHHPFELFATLFLFVSFVVLVHVLVFTSIVNISWTVIYRLACMRFKKISKNTPGLRRIKKKNASQRISTTVVSLGSSSLSPSSSNTKSPPVSVLSHANAASSSTSSNSLPPVSPPSHSDLASSSSSSSSPPVSAPSNETLDKPLPPTVAKGRRRGRRNRRH